MINALTIDVEDYFHVTAFEKQIVPESWDLQPLRVEDNTLRVLDLLDEYALKATFFVLGWVAERKPRIVREILRRGHELASHGFWHQLVYRQTPREFRADIVRAKGLLEDISGNAVYGYRAPSYSITERSLWALDILMEEGFRYDSSIFPIVHDIYGIPGSKRFPHRISTHSGKIQEFPISTFNFGTGSWSWRLPVAGGGWLRLLPAPLVKLAIQKINLIEHQPAIVYFHPWELDPKQPRIKACFKSRFRHYLNLGRMEQKVRTLLDTLEFATVQSVLDSSLDDNCLSGESYEYSYR